MNILPPDRPGPTPEDLDRSIRDNVRSHYEEAKRKLGPDHFRNQVLADFDEPDNVFFKDLRQAVLRQVRLAVGHRVPETALYCRVDHDVLSRSIAVELVGRFLGDQDGEKVFVCPHTDPGPPGRCNAYLVDMANSPTRERRDVHRSHQAIALLARARDAIRWATAPVPERVAATWWGMLLETLTPRIVRFLEWWDRELYPADGPKPIKPRRVGVYLLSLVPRRVAGGHPPLPDDLRRVHYEIERLLDRINMRR